MFGFLPHLPDLPYAEFNVPTPPLPCAPPPRPVGMQPRCGACGHYTLLHFFIAEPSRPEPRLLSNAAASQGTGRVG